MKWKQPLKIKCNQALQLNEITFLLGLLHSIRSYVMRIEIKNFSGAVENINVKYY